MFSNYSKMITDNCEFDKEQTNYLIQCHLQKLIEKFDKYFPNNEIDSRKLWIRDPYNITGIIPIYHPEPTMTL